MLDGFRDTPVLDRINWFMAALLVAFLAAPSLIVIPMSFSGSQYLQFPPHPLSLRWYAYFADSITWTHAARASLIAGVLTTVVSVPVGAFAAYGAMRLGARFRLLVSSLIVLPAVIPVILIAIGLFFVYARLNLIGSMLGLVLGHTALTIPVVFVVMSAAFGQFDRDQERAARSLGADWKQAWLTVVLPQLRGPVAASALLAFVTSLDEVVIAMFISSGESTTIPKVMFTSLRDEVEPTIAVVSTLLLFAASLVVAVVLRKGSAVFKV
ncbi:MAG TPA: ABC transporter permease [Dongiaceae bacterium]|nr:ABC transporter permease [Dongiaceae bacterium]